MTTPPTPSGPTARGRALLMLAAGVALLASAVALAYAGWEPAAIIGLISAMVAPLTLLIASIVKSDATHVMVNAQSTARERVIETQREELQAAGIPIPRDPSLYPPPSNVDSAEGEGPSGGPGDADWPGVTCWCRQGPPCA